MLSLNLSSLKRVLCLGAHCDDIEIGCGGAVLELIRQNPAIEVYWAVFSGNPQRKIEAKASARAFLKSAKTKTIRVANFHESFFPDEWAAIKAWMEKARKEFEPELVFTHYRDDRHQDHRVLSDLAWNTFRNHLILEYEILKYDGDLGCPNVFIPLHEDICRQKVAAILQHFQTQTAKHWFTADAFDALHRIRGIECAAPGKFAEAFYCRKLVIQPGQ